MSEAELLAMLKGAGSAPPSGGGGSAAATPAGSMEERLDDSDFKVRKAAYEELTKTLGETADPNDQVSSFFAPSLYLSVRGQHISTRHGTSMASKTFFMAYSCERASFHVTHSELKTL